MLLMLFGAGKNNRSRSGFLAGVVRTGAFFRGENYLR